LVIQLRTSFFPFTLEKRAVLKAKDLLESQGHTLVPFSLPDASQVSKQYAGFVYSDRLEGLSKVLDKDFLAEPAVSGCRKFARLLALTCPRFAQNLVRQIMTKLDQKFIYQEPYDSVGLLMRKRKESSDLCHDYLTKMNQAGIDAVLAPGSLVPAPNQGFLSQFPREVNVAYTPWNLFNFPAGVVPVAKVTKEDELEARTILASNGKYGQMMLAGCENSINLPLAVQVIGRRFQEEMVLRLMSEIQNASSY